MPSDEPTTRAQCAAPRSRATRATRHVAQPLGVLAALVAASLITAQVSPASAFCGFYVSGADASLYNDATTVVMMREGQRTVLSMQNTYQGPPENFAMVVPVPVVLQEENVKTLPREIFDRVDTLAAPRLVEYWERDPCEPEPEYMMEAVSMAAPPGMARRSASIQDKDLGVQVEAEFTVGEYEIVILSARDSSGLDTWLRQNQYNIPAGAEPVLRPYVQQGTKFFVAKVDISKVRFVEGRAVLSPLRVHYDSPEFSLPVRLGLLNSAGKQDLIVHVLAKNTRYEVANYENLTIPTNIRVKNDVREDFGHFYRALLDRALEKNPRTVVTEYAWDASTCDPCPSTPLQPHELMTLGADVLPSGEPNVGPGVRRRIMPRAGFVLTRLHYRYGKDDLGEDLIFRAAAPIIGGRGTPDQDGKMTEQTQPGHMNNFQGRYVILHQWEGQIACENPIRGRWGGPKGSDGIRPVPMPRQLEAVPGNPTNEVPSVPSSPTTTAIRSHNVGLYVADDIPELEVVAGVSDAPTETPASTGAETPQGPNTVAPTTSGGCASCTVGKQAPLKAPWLLFASAVMLAGAILRRRTR